jgi:hypothetical protein
MFRVVLPPIIRSAYNCIYSIWYLSHRYCHLPLSWKSWNRFECAVGGVNQVWKCVILHSFEMIITFVSSHFKVGNILSFLVSWCKTYFPPPPSKPGLPHCRCFTILLRHTAFGRTPLDQWSARRRDLYLTTHNTHKRKKSMLTAGFEPVIPAS